MTPSTLVAMADFDVSGQSYLIWYTHKYLH